MTEKSRDKIKKIVHSIGNYQEIVDFTINEIISDSSFAWWRDIDIEKRLNVAVGYSESYEGLEITANLHEELLREIYRDSSLHGKSMEWFCSPIDGSIGCEEDIFSFLVEIPHSFPLSCPKCSKKIDFSFPGFPEFAIDYLFDECIAEIMADDIRDKINVHDWTLIKELIE